MKKSNPEYLAKASQLSEEDKERLLSRMGGKLPKRLDKNKLSIEEALAMQLELEEEQLEEWRNRLRQMRAKDEAKAAKKGKEVAKSKPADAAPAAAKPTAAKSAKAKPAAAKVKPNKPASAKPTATAKPAAAKPAAAKPAKAATTKTETVKAKPAKKA